MNCLLGQKIVEQDSAADHSGKDEPLVEQLNDAQLQTMFPKWAWHEPFSSFGWKPKIPSSCVRLPQQINHVAAESWDHFLNFVFHGWSRHSCRKCIGQLALFLKESFA